MARKQSSKATKSEAPSKKTRQSKKEKEEVVEEKVVEEKVEETVVENKVKSRSVPTRESCEKEFDDLLELFENKILENRTSSKGWGVRVLKSLKKEVQQVRAHCLRVMKQKKVVKRAPNENSGFLKPVNISEELSKFTGWDADEKKSRVEVTKFICDYIKENDLQDPEDRRKIKADKKLQELLGYNPKKDAPLHYYSIQSYLKERGHFIKDK